MVKVKTKTLNKRNKPSPLQMDSVFIFKIILFLILGSQWLHIASSGGTDLPLPIGAVIGAFFAVHEHFKIDRKIEYAIILIAMFIGFWLPTGITVLR